MNARDEERMKKMLRQALPHVESSAEPDRDLWPAVLKGLDTRALAVPWFDWALAAGLVALIVVFPAAIPVFLYYL